MGHYFAGFLAPIWLSGRCPTAPIIPFPGAASLCPFPPAGAWRSLCACPLSRAPDYVLGHVLDGRCVSGNLLMRLLWPVFLLEVAMLPTVPIWLSGRCHRLVTPLFESCPGHCEAHARVPTLQASWRTYGSVEGVTCWSHHFSSPARCTVRPMRESQLCRLLGAHMAQWKVSQVGHTTFRVLPGAL